LIYEQTQQAHSSYSQCHKLGIFIQDLAPASLQVILHVLVVVLSKGSARVLLQVQVQLVVYNFKNLCGN
jgi:hypothetical protein